MPISSKGFTVPKDKSQSRLFYSFTGIHSLLIGLFLFYIPVYLWENGVSLAGISSFIAITGFSFCLTLWFFDRLSKRVAFRNIIAVSFCLEVLTLSSVFLYGSSFFVPCFALMLGVYNCFFWIIQRLLFVDMIAPDNSGQQFGNFQIYVVLILKMAVLVGGILLERYGFFSLYVLSIFFALCGALFFRFSAMDERHLKGMRTAKPLVLADIWQYRDRLHSKIIFGLDGFFLYLESYFWVISLFLLVKESFFHLGLLVIFLTVAFSLLFFFIKNRIDRSDKQRVYFLAVALYMVGWYLRGFVHEGMDNAVLYPLLVGITFSTSFFRLAFNKRFFDHAKEAGGSKYILMKSYYSQFFIGLVFAGLAWCYSFSGQLPQALHNLGYTYFAGGGLALLYLLYPPNSKKGIRAL